MLYPAPGSKEGTFDGSWLSAKEILSFASALPCQRTLGDVVPVGSDIDFISVFLAVIYDGKWTSVTVFPAKEFICLLLLTVKLNASFYFDYRHIPSYLGTNVSVSIQTETVLVDQSGSFADMKANMHARICVKFQHFEWRYLFFMIFTKTQCSQCFIWRISIILSLSS